MSAIDALGDAIEAAVEESPRATLQLLTGAFVGLTLALIRQAGHEPDDDVRIDSQGGRDITIHKLLEEAP